jgi:hypothetical protein
MWRSGDFDGVEKKGRVAQGVGSGSGSRVECKGSSIWRRSAAPLRQKRLAALVEGPGTRACHWTGLRRLRGKALLHCERELWGPPEMACSGDLMPSTHPCRPPTPTHQPMLPAWALHGGTPDAEACEGAKGLGADGWRSACAMPILPDSTCAVSPAAAPRRRTTLRIRRHE